MTFSICAMDPETGQVGVGALTAMMGVGKLVAHARAGVGAAASQATMNPYLALDGLTLLSQGLAQQAALSDVLDRDEGRSFRQVGLIGADGGTAAWTGGNCPGWAGHIEVDHAVALGNRLVGRNTLEAALEAFGSRPQLDLAHRLLEALEAGEATGADKQGALSGTISVMDTEDYPLWDVRVDHAEDPAAALRRLVADFDEHLVPQVRRLSTRQDYVGDLTREQMQQSTD